MSPNGQSVYVTNGGTDGTGGVSQYSVGAGGALAPMATPTVAGGDGPAGIAVTPDQGPVASFTVSATPAGSASSFNASGSSSVDSTVATYEWSFGDGSTSVERLGERDAYVCARGYVHGPAHGGRRGRMLNADGVHRADGVLQRERGGDHDADGGRARAWRSRS